MRTIQTVQIYFRWSISPNSKLFCCLGLLSSTQAKKKMSCFKKESSTKNKKPHRDNSSGITLSKVIASLGVQRQAFMHYVYTWLGLRSHSNSSKAEKCFRSRDTTMVISENSLKGATHSLTSIQPCPCLKWLKKNLDLGQQTTFNQSNHRLYSEQDSQTVEQRSKW